MHDLINLIVIILVAGIVMWLINAFIPMAGAIKSLLNILVLIVLGIYILQFFHLLPLILPMPQLVH